MPTEVASPGSQLRLSDWRSDLVSVTHTRSSCAAAPALVLLSALQCPQQDMLAPCRPFIRVARAKQHASIGSPCCPLKHHIQHLALVLPLARSKLPAAEHEHLMLPIGGGEPPCHLVGVCARRQPCQVHRRGACHQQLQQPLGAQGPQHRGARASRLVLLRSLCLRGCTR